MLPHNFTHKAQEALQKASQMTGTIDSLHLLFSLIQQKEGVIPAILQKMNINEEGLIKKINEGINLLSSSPKRQGQILVTQELKNILDQAGKEAERLGDEYISTEHLFLSMLEIKSKIKTLLEEFGLNYSEVLKILSQVRGGERVDSPEPENKYQSLEKYSVNLTKLAREEKLDPVIGRDQEIRRIIQVLSRRTKNNPVLIGEAGTGKTAIVEGLAQRIISGDVPETLKDKELMSLDLGAMVAGTKFRGEFEERLKTVLKEIKAKAGQIILFIDELHTLAGAGGSEGAIDASNMLKPALARGELKTIGATTLGEYQKHIEKDAALERRFQPVYVGEPSIEDTVAILRGIKEKYEVHHGVRITDPAIVAATHLSYRYISDRFLPDKAIDLIDEAASSLRMEIESMPEELDQLKRKSIKLEIEKRALKKEKDAQSRERLKIIEKELTNLKEQISQLELHWKTEKEIIDQIRKAKSSIDQLKAEAEILERKSELQKVAEIRYGKIPEIEKNIKKQEKKLNSLQRHQKILKEEVKEEDIANVVSRWTGIPVTRILETEQDKLIQAEKLLSQRVIGQKEAIHSIANALRRSRAGITDTNKPIGSFIFVGPTGVGKTELAKALAEFIFNDEKAIVRIDMSEYMEQHAVSRLIGSPPGYIGYEEGGQLTETVRRRPYSVILFDEIEKAHPEIFNLLLQILDEGRLTDGKGRTVNFKNTIIIMTSNLGNQIFQEFTFFDKKQEKEIMEKIEERIMEILTKSFKLEFLNRIDEIIVFHNLDKDNIKEIIDLRLKEVEKKLKEKNISLQFSPSLKQFFMEKGVVPHLGARPLKRAIQTYLIDPLAMKIIEGKIKEGEKVKTEAKQGKVIFS